MDAKELTKRAIFIIDNPPLKTAVKCEWCGGKGHTSVHKKDHPMDRTESYQGEEVCRVCNGAEKIRCRNDAKLVKMLLEVFKQSQTEMPSEELTKSCHADEDGLSHAGCVSYNSCEECPSYRISQLKGGE